MTDKIVTHAYLKEMFDYSPETGLIKWKKMGGRRGMPGDEAGYLTRLGYRSIGIHGKEYFGHRIAWFWVTGNWPEGEVDHINHIGDDNRWSNLRDVVKVVNGRNLSMKKNNISGHTGVFWSKKSKIWTAQICVNGKGIHLGCFEDIRDAVTARQKANIKYCFHDNHGLKNGSL